MSDERTTDFLYDIREAAHRIVKTAWSHDVGCLFQGFLLVSRSLLFVKGGFHQLRQGRSTSD
ncbi:hypothetical protein U27_06853 [Candidatus Vecturithrix granuli]|uniref:Uncharacterized protein n=1 Tax=Vecturithrix granuli TaxID=1499967 RepID=A0A081C5L2_VECG1|nr:hypothetical protein U27_06853 [Candidatus Vecturithrix granuli]